jgi:hypothetical protein
VFHHAEPGHVWQLGFQLQERLAIALKKSVEKPSPIRIAERLEDRFHGLNDR